MGNLAEGMQKEYSYKDYVELPSDKRYEIIEGILYAMIPAPAIQHQRVSGRLYSEIANYIKGKNCEVFNAPCDVLLLDKNEAEEDIKTVVQPDIFVVYDNSKITEKYCLGAPDFIIEIASPSSPSMDYVKKLVLYEKYKVREYWIVNYIRKEILAYRLQQNEEYGEAEVYRDGEISVVFFADMIIKLDDIFA